MKNTHFKRFVFLSLFHCLFFSGTYASSLKSENTSVQKETKAPLGSQEWVIEKIKLYPELQWLLDKTAQHTQEGKSENVDHSWSQKLTGHHYPEFERTLLSILNLHLIADGSNYAYAYFVTLQPPKEKISPAHFKRLHDFASDVLKNDPEQLKVIETNLLLGDMGKTPLAHKKAEQYGIKEADHDLFLDACLHKCPQIFPTFLKAPSKVQLRIIKTVGLIHFGHVVHVEGGPEILTNLKKSEIFKKNPKDFDFDILTYICDLSAARGHEDNRGSKVLTENTFKVIEAVKDTIHFLAKHNEQEALKFYLNKRAEWLGLNENEEGKYILARFGAMMRLFSKDEGKALQQAYASLSKDQKKIINQAFDPLVYRDERTPTYVPALLVNVLDSYTKQGLTREDAIKECVHKGALFVGTVLNQYRAGMSNQPYTPSLTLNFNKVAGKARDNLALLATSSFLITPDGLVDFQEVQGPGRK